MCYLHSWVPYIKYITISTVSQYCTVPAVLRWLRTFGTVGDDTISLYYLLYISTSVKCIHYVVTFHRAVQLCRKLLGDSLKILIFLIAGAWKVNNSKRSIVTQLRDVRERGAGPKSPY